jgi:hypothetical protein
MAAVPGLRPPAIVLRRNALECAKDRKIIRVCREQRIDSSALVSGGKKRVQYALASQTKAAMPDKELRHRSVAGNDVYYLMSCPPFLRQIARRSHAQRRGKSLGVNDYMNKFGKHLRGQRQSVPCRYNCGYFRPRGLMVDMLCNFGGNHESGVDAVIQWRSSNISPSKSSSVFCGRITRPRLTGAMSSTLCEATPFGRRLRIRLESHSNKLSCCSKATRRQPARFPSMLTSAFYTRK